MTPEETAALRRYAQILPPQLKFRMWSSVPRRDPANKRIYLSPVRPRIRNKPSWIPGYEQCLAWNRAANAGKPICVISMEHP